MLEAEGLDKSVKHVDDSELLVKHQSFFMNIMEYQGNFPIAERDGHHYLEALLGEILMKHQRSIIMEISHPPLPPKKKKHVSCGNGRSPRDSLVVWPMT